LTAQPMLRDFPSTKAAAPEFSCLLAIGPGLELQATAINAQRAAPYLTPHGTQRPTNRISAKIRAAVLIVEAVRWGRWHIQPLLLRPGLLD